MQASTHSVVVSGDFTLFFGLEPLHFLLIFLIRSIDGRVAPIVRAIFFQTQKGFQKILGWGVPLVKFFFATRTLENFSKIPKKFQKFRFFSVLQLNRWRYEPRS